jgi:hypothetical protein
MLDDLSHVYLFDAQAREQNLSPQARLEFHKANSGPIMAELHDWMQSRMDGKLVEPNSALGAAFKYMLKHWEALTGFLKTPGAPLDNNLRTNSEKGHPAQKKQFVLQDSPWRPCRRHLHPNLQILRSQCL